MYFLAVECTDSLKTILGLAHTILNLIKFAVPIVLIIYGSWDLAKAVIASKEDEIKKQQQLFVKRVIAALLVFFVSLFVDLALGLLPDSITGTTDWQTCWRNS